MTEISEVLAAIRKGNLALEEGSKELADSLELIMKGLADLEGPIQDLIDHEKKQNEEIAKFESDNLSLSREISSLENEKAENEKTLEATKEKLSNTTDMRVNLETQQRETSSELTNSSKALDSAKTDLSNETEKLERLEGEIKILIQSSEKQLEELGKLAEQKRDAIRRATGEQMALKYLIKNKHVDFNEMKIINSLEGRTNTDLSTIAKVTGISEDQIEKTLLGLMKRNLLEYDSNSGLITIIGSLEL